jgi:hypothetical protein
MMTPSAPVRATASTSAMVPMPPEAMTPRSRSETSEERASRLGPVRVPSRQMSV